MEIIQDESFLHINRTRHPSWIVGTEFLFGRTENWFMTRFNTTEHMLSVADGTRFPLNRVVAHALRVYEGSAERDPSLSTDYHYEPIKSLRETWEALRDSLIYIREEVFEEVRQSSFVELPSRKRCIWLIPDEPDTMAYWWRTIGNPQSKIFRVTATGKVHRVAQNYLQLQTCSLNTLKERAFRYWAGFGNQAAGPEDELLFEGFIKVEEEIDPTTIGLELPGS